MNSVILALWLVGSMLISTKSIADEYVTATHTMKTSSSCKDGQPRKKEDYAYALKQAKATGLRKWAARNSPAVMKLFNNDEAFLFAEVDKYILDPRVVIECNGKEFTLLMKGLISTNAINQLMIQQAPRVTKNMATLFISRSVSSIQSFDTKRSDVQRTVSTNDGNETLTYSGDSANSSSSSSKTQMQQKGGSSERKSADIIWKASRASGLDAATNQIFTSYGIEAIDLEQVEQMVDGMEIQTLIENFCCSTQPDKQALNSIRNGLSAFNRDYPDSKIELLSIVTVDVNASYIDDVTGNTSVSVSVTGQVFQKKGIFWKNAASVKPTQITGQGVDEIVASTTAMNLAAEKAAMEIVSQLTTKQLK
jgi:hypothetical protein